ncbi:Protein of unknown function [Gryllus bimaculatus]|nr:Protein of unknown function [Gryllus bimaculatus]
MDPIYISPTFLGIAVVWIGFSQFVTGSEAEKAIVPKEDKEKITYFKLKNYLHRSGAVNVVYLLKIKSFRLLVQW